MRCKAAIEPIHNATARPIPHHDARLNARPAGDHDHHEHQFAIAAEQEIGAVGGLVNR